MRKIPSVFMRDHEGTGQVFNEVTPGCEWVLDGEGVPTRKWDGTSCMVKDGRLFKRYDRKRDRKTGEHKPAPEGWIACEDEPNEHTGHWPGWVPVDPADKADRWHALAWRRRHQTFGHNGILFGRTYELIGPTINGNPEDVIAFMFRLHGADEIRWPSAISPGLVDRTLPVNFHTIHAVLATMPIEGLVWHHPDGRMAKVKRRDFGLPWPIPRDA